MSTRLARIAALCLVPVLLASCRWQAPPPDPPLVAAAAATSEPTATPSDIRVFLASETPAAKPSIAATATPIAHGLATEADIEAPTPLRNLNDLARRLRLPPGTVIPPYVNPRPVDLPVGTTATFWINDALSPHYFSISATIRYRTAHLYMYVQDGVPYAVSQLQAAADDFEQKLYPTDRAVFGDQLSPGIDHDVHISVINGKIPGVGGYFSSTDEYAKAVVPYSNQRQIIYINLDALQPGTDFYAATLAHEFQHMIEFHVRPHANAWLNEGASIFAQSVNHLPLGAGIPGTFFGQPNTQLDQWVPNVSASLPHYGASYLWLDYFTQRFGGASVLHVLLDSNSTDLGTFRSYLRQHGGARLSSVFGDWAVANYLNDPSVAGGKYGYANVQGHALETGLVQPDVPFSTTVQPYASRYLVVMHPAGTTIHFQGAATTRLMAHQLPPGATGEWWSNRHDRMDTRLTRTVDLTGVKSAHLTYDIWYDIERSFDYGFVEASTDGKYWKTLPATHTTTANPNGANYGAGYTGTSAPGGAVVPRHGNGPQPTWLHESVDLTPYAGKKIAIRFEYVTDDSYAGPGIGVANIAIPELHWKDDPRNPVGWQADGWLPTDDRIPQHFLVQAILMGRQPSVMPIPLDAHRQGQLTIPANVSAGRLVLVINAFAAKTTEPAPFTVRVNRRQ